MQKRALEEKLKPSEVQTLREIQRIRYGRENGTYPYNKERYVNDRHVPPREYRINDTVGQREIAEETTMENLFWNRKNKR